MKVGVLTDLHLPVRPNERGAWHGVYDYSGVRARLQRAMRHFADERVDAVAALGDLAEHGDLDSLTAAMRLLSATWRGPSFVVAGNHDCLQRDDQLDRAKARCGARVRHTRLCPERIGEFAAMGVRIRSRTGGLVGAWTLPPDRVPLLVASHFPVLSRADALAACGLRYAGDLANRSELGDALARRRHPVIVLAGHLHVRDAHHDGAVLQLSSGALVEPPFECAVVELRIERGTVRVRRRCLALPPSAGRAVSVLSPDDETWSWSDGTWTPA